MTSGKPHYENVPFEIPESWEWVTLNELYNPISSKRVLQADWQKNGVPFYRAREIVKLSQYGFVDNELFITEGHYQALKENYGIPEPNDIMLSAVGTIGKTYIVKTTDKFYYKDASVLCLQNLFDSNSQYIQIALDSTFVQKQMHEQSKGTTVDTITIEKAGEYYFPLPPQKEQIRIVSEIEKWFAIIDDLEKIKQDFQDQIKSAKSEILKLAITGKLVSQDNTDESAIELLRRIDPTIVPCDTSHYPNLPQGWCVATLGDVGKWRSGGTPNRKIKEYYGGDIPWLKTGDLNDGFITDIPEKITQAGLENSSAKMNPAGSVLVAMYGATIGKIGVLTFPATTNQACCACVEYPALDMMYLYYFLLSNREIFITQGGGGAQPNISKEIIINTQIPIPPMKEQKRIVDKISELFKEIDSITMEL